MNETIRKLLIELFHTEMDTHNDELEEVWPGQSFHSMREKSLNLCIGLVDALTEVNSQYASLFRLVVAGNEDGESQEMLNDLKVRIVDWPDNWCARVCMAIVPIKHLPQPWSYRGPIYVFYPNKVMDRDKEITWNEVPDDVLMYCILRLLNNISNYAYQAAFAKTTIGKLCFDIINDIPLYELDEKALLALSPADLCNLAGEIRMRDDGYKLVNILKELEKHL